MLCAKYSTLLNGRREEVQEPASLLHKHARSSWLDACSPGDGRPPYPRCTRRDRHWPPACTSDSTFPSLLALYLPASGLLSAAVSRYQVGTHAMHGMYRSSFVSDKLTHHHPVHPAHSAQSEPPGHGTTSSPRGNEACRLRRAPERMRSHRPLWARSVALSPLAVSWTAGYARVEARALVNTLRWCCWELHPDRGTCSYVSERALLVKFRAGRGKARRIYWFRAMRRERVGERR